MLDLQPCKTKHLSTAFCSLVVPNERVIDRLSDFMENFIRCVLARIDAFALRIDGESRKLLAWGTATSLCVFSTSPASIMVVKTTHARRALTYVDRALGRIVQPNCTSLSQTVCASELRFWIETTLY